VLQEDIDGVVAAAFTHWDSRSWDPQLHDHVVVSNRARSVSDGTWRTLDGRALFKNVVTLSELHQGANRPPFGPRFAVVRRPPASAVRLML
jgi:hypothetical protein